MRIYISGPISAAIPGMTFDQKLDAFYQAEYDIKQQVLKGNFHLNGTPDHVFNPLQVKACKKRDCGGRPNPAVAGEWEHSWKCYMIFNIQDLMKCDAICLLPGWIHSPGARLEATIAHNFKMELYTATPGLEHHFDINKETWDGLAWGWQQSEAG